MRDDESEDKPDINPLKGNIQTTAPIKDPGPTSRFFSSHNVSKVLLLLF